MTNVLKTYDLTKTYGSATVVDHVNITLKQGDIYGLIGKNGAGKTTLMKMLGGIAAPTSGTFEFFDEKNNRKTSKRIGCLIESPSLYPDMKVEENLIFYNKLLGITDNSNVEEILELVNLKEARKKKTKKLSLGMKQRLGIGIALIGYPDMLILDEPINGLDPTGIVDVRNLLLRLRNERGMTILISSHILGELSKLATRYGIINKGVLVDELTQEELLAKSRQAIKIECDDPKAVAVILEQMSITDYKVMQGSCIYVYCDPARSGEINAKLATSGVYVNGISTVGEDPEEYFVEKMGGIDHD